MFVCVGVDCSFFGQIVKTFNRVKSLTKFADEPLKARKAIALEAIDTPDLPEIG